VESSRWTGLNMAKMRKNESKARDGDHQPECRMRLRGTVFGRVQGVGFRAFVQRHCQRLGLDGWVRNIPGNRVEVDATGPETAIRELHELLQRGPLLARVDSTDLELTEAGEDGPQAGCGFRVTR
jgi:acylphosphatase